MSKKDGLTEHHFVPRSRLSEFGLKNSPENVTMIPESVHGAWHHCFNKMTPWEVIDFLGQLSLIFGKETRCWELRAGLVYWIEREQDIPPWEKLFKLLDYFKGREFIRCLSVIFRDQSIEEVIETVKRDWSGKDRRYQSSPLTERPS